MVFCMWQQEMPALTTLPLTTPPQVPHHFIPTAIASGQYCCDCHWQAKEVAERVEGWSQTRALWLWSMHSFMVSIVPRGWKFFLGRWKWSYSFYLCTEFPDIERRSSASVKTSQSGELGTDVWKKYLASNHEKRVSSIHNSQNIRNLNIHQ